MCSLTMVYGKEGQGKAISEAMIPQLGSVFVCGSVTDCFTEMAVTSVVDQVTDFTAWR